MPIIDISDRVVHDLGTSYSSGSISTPTGPDSMKWDCSLGGQKFLFFMDRSFPNIRQTAPFRRERIDTTTSPGDQSLDSGYWLRSQQSWHMGSGLASAEPLEVASEQAIFRYKTGGGVDPWTPGEMSLLNDTASVLSSVGSNQQLIGVNTGVLHADDTVVKYIDTAGAVTSVTWGGSVNSITSLTTDGANYYAANATGIYKGTLPSGAGSLIWNTGSSTVARWVKSRLMATVGGAVYELTGTGPALPTALYTHPVSGWTWTDISEGPSSIYLSGYAGDTSMIYRVAVTTSSTSVTLSQPSVVADLPRGETVLSMYSYVGAYLIVGTNKGTRIASIQSDGSLALGPLIVSSSDGCTDAVAYGSYVYVTVGGKGEAGNRVQRPGLYRINLGRTLNGDDLQFASAADLVAPSGTSGQATQVTTAGDAIYFAVSGAGVFKQQSTYVSEGWWESGRVRMGTSESKAWRLLRLLQKSTTTGTLTGFVNVDDSAAPSGWTQIVATATSQPDVLGSLAAGAPGTIAQVYFAFKLTAASSATTPTMVGYSVKAVPAPARSEVHSVNLLCFDRETDRQGSWYGQPGNAWLKFSQIKALENAAGTIEWVDYTTGERAEVFIEEVKLTRLTPPTRNQNGAGGILTVSLRVF